MGASNCAWKRAIWKESRRISTYVSRIGSFHQLTIASAVVATLAIVGLAQVRAQNGAIPIATVGHVDAVTDHGVAQPFWAFMTSEGLVHEDGNLVEDVLLENPFYATGRPVTEAYWTDVKVTGEQRDVLIQCFEPQCLTYTPGNSEGFVVEAGNVGRHYYHWRYVQAPG